MNNMSTYTYEKIRSDLWDTEKDAPVSNGIEFEYKDDGSCQVRIWDEETTTMVQDLPTHIVKNFATWLNSAIKRSEVE